MEQFCLYVSAIITAEDQLQRKEVVLLQGQPQPGEYNPWHDAETRYQPGQEVHGPVTRVTHFGVFMQIEPDLIGVIYTFELGPGLAALTGFVPGQEIHAYVKSIDAGRKRLELGLSQSPTSGLLAEHAIPAALRRGKLPDELPQSMPRPQELLYVPDAPSEQSERACPTCQRSIQAVWKHCVYCGGSLRRHCLLCGSLQPDLLDARYCCECGKMLS